MLKSVKDPGAGCTWTYPITQRISLECNCADPFWDFAVLVGQFAEEQNRELAADRDPGGLIAVHYMPTDQALAQVLPWGIDPDDRGEPHINEFMTAIRKGVRLPPCLADQSGILDGRHRIHAASRLGIPQVPYILLEDTFAPLEDITESPASADQYTGTMSACDSRSSALCA